MTSRHKRKVNNRNKRAAAASARNVNAAQVSPVPVPEKKETASSAAPAAQEYENTAGTVPGNAPVPPEQTKNNAAPAPEGNDSAPHSLQAGVNTASDKEDSVPEKTDGISDLTAQVDSVAAHLEDSTEKGEQEGKEQDSGSRDSGVLNDKAQAGTESAAAPLHRSLRDQFLQLQKRKSVRAAEIITAVVVLLLILGFTVKPIKIIMAFSGKSAKTPAPSENASAVVTASKESSTIAVTEDPIEHETAEVVEEELTEKYGALEGTGSSSGRRNDLYVNYALFGVDSRDGNLGKGARSDSIMVLSLDETNNKARLVSVYRDTYLPVTSGSYNKANSAYAYGGPEKAVEMLEQNLDIEIEDYVSVDFSALADSIDALGGVTLDITEDEIRYLNEYEEIMARQQKRKYVPVEKAGVQKLNGLQATAYCRIRYTTGDDYKRTERQRTVLSQLGEEVKDATVIELLRMASSIFPKVNTSLTMSETLSLLGSAADYDLVGSDGLPQKEYRREMNLGSAGSVVVPATLEDNVRWLHKWMFGDSLYEPSDTVLEASSAISQRAGLSGGYQKIVQAAVPAEGEAQTAGEASTEEAVPGIDPSLPADQQLSAEELAAQQAAAAAAAQSALDAQNAAAQAAGTAPAADPAAQAAGTVPAADPAAQAAADAQAAAAAQAQAALDAQNAAAQAAAAAQAQAAAQAAAAAQAQPAAQQ